MSVINPHQVSLIDALLPQTQCRQCGYAGCRPYAEAISAGSADINQCPPGGDAAVHELAHLLGVAFKHVDARFGITKPPAIAVIDESLCIGCTLCIQACPVDAIVGAAGAMHTVVERDCTGCELCMPPCPVSCIAMADTGAHVAPDERRSIANRARARFQRHTTRLGTRSRSKPVINDRGKKATVQRAITRAKIRLAQRKFS
jgi:electron transport complex protein RnfB